MNRFVLAVIFARGGSKGLPRKNIRPLCGKPLIAYAIEKAKVVGAINEVIVSTDDEGIASVARRYGAGVPFMRPKQLAEDDTPVLLAWRHAIEQYQQLTGIEVDAMVSVPPTAPLREAVDIENCLNKLLATDADVVITVKPSDRNPYFNMVTMDEAGYATLAAGDEKIITRRQDAPKTFDVTTVAYAVRPRFLAKAPISIFQGKVAAVEIPAERALDIDTELDFKMAEFFMRQRES